MSTNLTTLKSFLGKYYSELLYSSGLDKYKQTGLDEIFEQRFQIQQNKVQMIVDPGISGLVVVITGNEVHISKELYDHPNVVVTNSLESNQASNPRSLYNAETVPTMAYLMCQNHTTFQIVGEIEEPIYVKYRSDFECFYSSVLVFNVSNEVEVEIVEEIESFSALNAVTNYILHPSSRLNLTTFYQNTMSSFSMCYRNVFGQDNSKFNHMLLGKGSYKAIDETKIRALAGSSAEMLGIVNSEGKNFHSILYVEPGSPDYSINVNYRDIVSGNAAITFFPVILGTAQPETATIDVSHITLEDIPAAQVDREVKNYVSDIIERATLERIVGVQRFYSNKKKFLHFP